MRMPSNESDRVRDLYKAASQCGPANCTDFLRRNSADEVESEEHENIGSLLSTALFVNDKQPVKQPTKRFAPGEVLAERFRIVEFIAAGGMGEVYEAEDLTLKESVAIKTVRPDVLEEGQALARFKREVQLARRVTHPNVCRVFDLFWHKKTEGNSESAAILFVSMELLKGETLTKRLRRVGRFTAEEALPLIDQIASGLEAAHRAAVVHRDLNPGNVMLVPDRKENQLRSVITDFGLAMRTGVVENQSVDLTALHGIFGTLPYMSPEQIEGKEVTQLADIYALGLIIYEMVTGKHAFPANTPLASAARRLSDSVESPNRFAPQLSARWERTINRCLERDPVARFHSAMDVARALDQPTSVAISSPMVAYAAPGQQHFESGFDVQKLPEGWSSSADASVIVNFVMRDAVFDVDNYSGQSRREAVQKRSKHSKSPSPGSNLPAAADYFMNFASASDVVTTGHWLQMDEKSRLAWMREAVQVLTDQAEKNLADTFFLCCRRPLPCWPRIEDIP
jgi:serine/threonine protein kinase